MFWICLNTNDSSLGNPGPSGFGFIIQDDKGLILGGGNCYTGHTTLINVEFIAILRGLQYCSHKGYCYIIYNVTLKLFYKNL